MEPAAQLARHAVDHLAADQGLAHRRRRAPLRAILEQVKNRHRKIVVGRQQACAFCDDPVPVVIGIAGKGDVEAVLEADQALHGPGRGRVHADLSVPIDGHETERGINHGVHHRQIQAVALGNCGPVMDACTTEGIDAHAHAGTPDRVHVEHAAQIAHVAIHKIMPVRGGGTQRLLERHSCHAPQAVFQVAVGAGFDPAGHVVARRPAVGRVVLVAATVRRIV